MEQRHQASTICVRLRIILSALLTMADRGSADARQETTRSVLGTVQMTAYTFEGPQGTVRPPPCRPSPARAACWASPR